jgi:hypothetical protein
MRAHAANYTCGLYRGLKITSASIAVNFSCGFSGNLSFKQNRNRKNIEFFGMEHELTEEKNATG